MPRRSTKAPSGPTITRGAFNINEVEAALTDYAVTHGGALPVGPKRVTTLKVTQAGDAAVLEIKHN